MRLRWTTVLRHAAGIILFYFAWIRLAEWYTDWGRWDYLFASFSYLLGLVCTAGSFVWREFRTLSPVRKGGLVLLAVLLLPWGEWLQLGLPASRQDWSRQILIQTLILYSVIVILHLVPRVCLLVHEAFQRFLNFASGKPAMLVTLPVLFFLLTATISLWVHRETLLIQDSAAHFFQAKILASGKLYAEAPVPERSFSTVGDSLVMKDGRWFSMYTPGFALLLALALKIRLEWVLCPLLGALSLHLWLRYIRKWDTDRAAFVFGILFLTSPFLFLMSSVMMVHVPELLLVTLLIYLFRSQTEKETWSGCIAIFLVSGFAVLVRGFSILAFVAPAFLYSVWLVRKRKSFRMVVAVFAGVLLGSVLLGVYQKMTTGNFLLPGYVLEYPNYSLGFRKSFLGQMHTPLRGLENTSNHLLGLNVWLSGWYIGAMAILAVCFAKLSFQIWDRVLLCCCIALLSFYFFIVHQDLVIGPRFLFPLAPVLLLWISKLIVESKNRTLTSLLLILLLSYLPFRFPHYLKMYDPVHTAAGNLKREIENSASRRFVLLDRNVQQTFVNWNDPFLNEKVIIARDLGEENQGLLAAYPDFAPCYFRLVTETTGNQMEAGYRCADKPDPKAGSVNLLGLGLSMVALQQMRDADLFDLGYQTVFTPVGAESDLDYIRNAAERAGRQSVQDYYKLGLLQSAAMMLHPKEAYEENRPPDPEQLRSDLRATERDFEQAGDLGQIPLAQLAKIQKRIDRNRDDRLSDHEIVEYLQIKFKYLDTR